LSIRVVILFQISELKEMACKEFTINNILNTKQGSGEIVRSVYLKFIKHSGLSQV